MKLPSSLFNKVHRTSSPPLTPPHPRSTNTSAASTASRSVIYFAIFLISITRVTVSSFTLPLPTATASSSTMTKSKFNSGYQRNASLYKKDEDMHNLNSNLLTRTRSGSGVSRGPQVNINMNMRPNDNGSSPSSSNAMSRKSISTTNSRGLHSTAANKKGRAAGAVSSLLSSFQLNFSKRSTDTINGDGDGVDGKNVSQLQEENELLRQSIIHLEQENHRLEKSHARQSIILEQFEGERQPGDGIESTWWDKESDDNVNGNTNGSPNSTVSSQNRDVKFGDLESQPINLGLTHRDVGDDCSRGSSITTASHNSIANTTVSISFPTPITALEECDEDDDGCPIEPDISFKDALKDRACWLVGLLTLQSMSGFILARNEQLLQTHPVIVYFLTMLVGAGGNAGNQAAVRVIRGIALGTLNERTQRKFLNREFKMAMTLSVILSCAGFVRATVFGTPFAETVAVTSALAIIVFISICLGAVLPLMLRKIDVDPAHSSTTIQVIMDILGVILTVFVSTTILDTPLGHTIIDKLSFNS